MTAQMPKAIAEAVSAIMGEVDYVQKKGENKFHNYKFAAVGDILAKLQPSMAKAGLCIVQNELGHRLSEDSGIMTAEYEFLLSHKSGVTWEERPRHTGMATAKNTKGGFDDKALNKCHTAARKYFLLALFQIPTGELPDADAQEDTESPPPPPKQQAARSSGNGQTRNVAAVPAEWTERAATWKKRFEECTTEAELKAAIEEFYQPASVDDIDEKTGEVRDKVSPLQWFKIRKYAATSLLNYQAMAGKRIAEARVLTKPEPELDDSQPF